jgi:hypothetical protein
MRNRAILLVPVMLLVACGGGGGTTTPPVAAAANPDSVTKDVATKAAAVKKAAAAPHHVFDTAAAAGMRPLVRETYHYDAASVRDPFKPFVDQVERGPELPDLRLVALLYDERNPNASIATFRDIGNDHRYTVSPGQRIGRISVVSVTASTVKLRIDDFGTTREQTYAMRKPEDQKP